MKKYRTYEQTQTAQERAIGFAENVLGDSDLADELSDLSPEEYASRKGIIVTNPIERRTKLANGNGNGDSLTKSDLQDICDSVETILTDAYQVESSREDLAGAIADCLDILQGNAPPSDGDGDDDDDAG